MSRPALEMGISAEDFQAFYWLKEELVTFCRTEELATSGGKQEIAHRITHYLQTGEKLKPARKATKKGKMPDAFHPDTVIEEGWRCSQPLRYFFEQQIGKSFHFNKFLRSYIQSEGVGHTLQEAIDGWHLSKSHPKGSSEISSQFEYNRFIRQFMLDNPSASLQDGIAAWNIHKAQRKTSL